MSAIREDDPPPLIHFLRCPECAFVSINLNRFKQHMPCCLREQPTKYFTYACSACQAMSTNRDVMEEHREIYHKGCHGLIVESCDTIKTCSLASFIGSSAAEDNLEKNACRSMATLFTCSLCSFSCTSTKRLIAHVQSMHSASQASVHVSSAIGQAQFEPSLNSLQEWLEMLRTSSNALLSSQQVMTSILPASENGPVSCGSLKTGTPTIPSQTSNFSCDACGALFMTENQLDDHVHSLHSISNVLNSQSLLQQQQHLMTSMIKSAALLDAAAKGMLISASACDMSNAVHDQQPSHQIFDSSLNPNCLSNGLSSANNTSDTVHEKQCKSLTRVKLETNSDDIGSQKTQCSEKSSTITTSNASVKSVTCDDGKPVHNTMRKTNSDMKVIRRFFQQQCSEFREPHLISASDLDDHLQKFVAKARKKDGHEYEPESLKAFVHSMERHLKIFGYKSSILTDEVFAGTRNVLQARMQTLRELSRVNLSGSLTIGLHGNSALGSKKNLLSVENTERLIQSGLLGPNSSQSLINTLWYINRVHFGIRGSHKHRNLKWGQFRIISTTDEATVKRTKVTCHDYLQFTPNSASDEHQFYMPNKSNSDQSLLMDALDIFRVYSNMRPVEARNSSDPFYLVCDPDFEHGGPWFKPYGASLSILGNIPKKLGVRPSTFPNNNVASDKNLSAQILSKAASISQCTDDTMSDTSMEVCTVSPQVFPSAENIYLDHFQLSMIEDASNEMAVDMSMH